MGNPITLRAITPLASRSVADVKKMPAGFAGTTNKASLPKLMQLASDLSKQPPPVDMPRIAAIRSAIANGSFTISAEKIADSMLNQAYKAS